MTPRIRLALVDPTMTPYRMHFHRRIATELPVRLWSVRLHDRDLLPWTLEPPPELQPVSFDAPRPPGRCRGALADLAKGRRIARWLDEQDIDAVVVGGWGDLSRLVVIEACARAGRPCLVFADSNVRCDRSGATKRALLPLLLRRCAGVLVCGTRGREFFRRYGVPEERIFVSPYEADIEVIRGVVAADIEAASRRHGLAPGRRRLLFSGRLAPEKRIDLLLDAFAELSGLRPDWDLVVAGEGPLGEELRRRVPAALRDRVIFLGFVDTREELGAVYRSCDVLVLPSDFEPWGVVVSEGAAAGLALVCSDVVGAAADLLADGVSGRTFKAGSRADLSSALLDVTLPERLARYRSAAADAVARWREQADPVRGLAAALGSLGLLRAEHAAAGPGAGAQP